MSDPFLVHDALRTVLGAGHEQFRLIADTMPQFVWSAAADGRIEYVNRRWIEYTGHSVESLRPEGLKGIVHPDEAPLAIRAWRDAVASGEPYELEYRLRNRADGSFRWFLARAVPVHDEHDAIAMWIGTATDVDDQKRARESIEFVLEAEESFAGRLAVREVCEAFARVAIRRFADWCFVQLYEEPDRFVTVAAAHRDPQRMHDIDAFVRRYPMRVRPGMADVLRDGPMLVAAVTEEQIVAGALDEEHLAIMRSLQMRSVMVIPLHGTEGELLGIVTLVSAESGRVFTTADLSVAERIGRRAAAALATARRFEEERRAADREHRVSYTFQRASLPGVLPSVPGTALSAKYEAGRSEALVGGDWYDAFRLQDGRLVLSIGDVSGSGLDAAVLMGSVRQSIRTAAVINADPGMVLDAVDRIVRESGSRFVTAFVAIFDPLYGELSCASAGHPAPLQRAPDGSVTPLRAAGLPLGLRDRQNGDAPETLVLAPGSLLLFYTDGLSEIDRDVLDGERRIVAALAAAPASPSATVLYENIVAARSTRDDVAMLLLHYEGSPFELPGMLRAPRWSFESADAAASASARRAFCEVLHERGFQEIDVALAEIVFGELTGNVVRYAPGPVDVALDTTGMRPVLHVLDGGEGFELNPRLPADALAERGRGLFIVDALADEFTIARRAPRGSHARAVLRVSRTVARRTQATG
jgi:PAS domain S-box-containing protein